MKTFAFGFCGALTALLLMEAVGPKMGIGISVNGAGWMPTERLMLNSNSPLLLLNCYQDTGDSTHTTKCSITFDEDDIKHLVGVPNSK